MSNTLDFLADFNRAMGGSCNSIEPFCTDVKASGFLGAGRGRGRAANDVVMDRDRLGDTHNTLCASLLDGRVINMVCCYENFSEDEIKRPST